MPTYRGKGRLFAYLSGGYVGNLGAMGGKNPLASPPPPSPNPRLVLRPEYSKSVRLLQSLSLPDPRRRVARSFCGQEQGRRVTACAEGGGTAGVGRS